MFTLPERTLTYERLLSCTILFMVLPYFLWAVSASSRRPRPLPGLNREGGKGVGGRFPCSSAAPGPCACPHARAHMHPWRCWRAQTCAMASNSVLCRESLLLPAHSAMSISPAARLTMRLLTCSRNGPSRTQVPMVVSSHRERAAQGGPEAARGSMVVRMHPSCLGTRTSSCAPPVW